MLSDVSQKTTCQALQTKPWVPAAGAEQARTCKESAESPDSGRQPTDTRSDISSLISLPESSVINTRQRAAVDCDKAATLPASHAHDSQPVAARRQQSEGSRPEEVSA